MRPKELGHLDEIEKPEIIVLTSNSLVKTETTKNAALSTWENVEVVGNTVESGVSNNPYTGLETLQGALQRIENLVVENRPSQCLSIESGIFPTHSMSAEDSFILTVQGKAGSEIIERIKNNKNPFEKIIKIAKDNMTEAIVDLSETPLNTSDQGIKPTDESANFFDRAVVVSYDLSTNKTYIGISEGIAFPQTAVEEAIHVHKGAIRVSESIKKTLFKTGVINENDIVKDGALKGLKFDIQDPHILLTNGKTSRVDQIAHIEAAVFKRIKNARISALA